MICIEICFISMFSDRYKYCQPNMNGMVAVGSWPACKSRRRTGFVSTWRAEQRHKWLNLCGGTSRVACLVDFPWTTDGCQNGGRSGLLTTSKCECVCAWKKNIVSALKWCMHECLYVCCIALYEYVCICMSSLYSKCVCSIVQCYGNWWGST